MQAMLSAHPGLTIPPETDFFDSAVPCDEPDAGWLGRWLASEEWGDQGIETGDFRASLGDDPSPRDVFLAVMAAHASRAGARRVGEKTPQHYKHVERIGAMFPRARFIHVVRDPRAVVASRLRAGFASGSATAHARSWRRTARVHAACLESMPGDRYTELRYEALVTDPEPELRRLCAFLEEDFDPAMLRFHERAESGFAERERAWKGGADRPLYTGSLDAWRERLTPRQTAAVERVAGREMLRFGYEPDAAQRIAWRIADGAAELARRV